MSLPGIRRAALACVLVLTLAGCARGPQPVPGGEPKTVTPTRTLVFDMSHGEIFGPDNTTELGQSRAVERMRASGFNVVVNTDPITAEDLEGASGLFLAGPMRPLAESEYAAINDFVERGGTAVLTIHVPFPVMAVPAHWGLPVVPSIMLSSRPLDPTDATVFMATGVSPGYVTQHVSELLVVSGWPVQSAAPNAEVVVKAGPDGWLDANGNGTRETSETADLGVVGSATVGKGHVVVIGDDAVFANIAIDKADNATLLDNILEMMRGAFSS